MWFKRGKHRLVIGVPQLGIVIKLPRVYLIRALHILWVMPSLPRNERQELFSWKTTNGPLRLLFKGWLDNWRERSFYRRTRHVLLEPTAFSLFGLVNIQRLAPIYPDTDGSVSIRLWSQLLALTRPAELCPHHFQRCDNFALRGRQITVVDYGDPDVQVVIEKHGARIAERFDPDWQWSRSNTQATLSQNAE